MRRKLIQIQVKMVTIVSPADTIMSHGFCDNIPGKEWYRGEFTTQADADAKFAEIKRRFQTEEADKGSWMRRPEMKIEWETLSTQVVPEY